MRTSCIRLRARSRIAVLYEDFLEICKGNMLAAMLLAILVYWTDIKIKQKESNLWIWKSHTDFQEDLMFDKPGMKPPHRTTIKAALDLLVELKFIERRKNPKMPLDQTKQYLVDQKAVQDAVDALPPIVEKTTLERRNTDNATSNNQQSMSENRQCNAEIPTSNTSDYSTVITDSEITDSEEDTGDTALPALEPADAASLRQEHQEMQERISDTAARLAAIRLKGQDEDVEATVKRPAVQAPSQTVRGTEPAHADGAAPAHSPAATPPVAASGPRRSGQAPRPVIPARPKQQERPQLTLRGSQVKEWMQEIWGTSIRMSAGNIADLNDLGDNPDVSQESLAATWKIVSSHKWVKDQDFTVTLRIFAGNDKRENVAFLSFESNWPKAKQRLDRQKQRDAVPTLAATGTDDYTGFDIYKGNGPEERAKLREYAASAPAGYWDED